MKADDQEEPIVMTPWLNINNTAPTVAIVDPTCRPT